MGRGLRKASLSAALAGIALAAPAHAQEGRPVIAVFPVAAPEITVLDVKALEAATAKLHALISRSRGFLTVPRAVVRRAVAGGQSGEDASKLEQRVRELEREHRAAEGRVRAAKDASDVALDDQDDEAAAVIKAAEAEVIRINTALTTARAAATKARAATQSRLTVGCTDVDCLERIARQVGASKVLRSVYRASNQSCTLALTFYALDAGLTDLTLREQGACSAAGLDAAIASVGEQIAKRDAAGYRVFEQDLAAGTAIENPPTKLTARLAVFARALGDPNEVLDVFINGKEAGALKGGAFSADIEHGDYIIVVKSRSPNFSPRRFDVRVDERGVRVPVRGQLTLQPVFGAVEFDLIDGPWTLRSGELTLVPTESLPVRPGDVPVQFFLEGRPVGEVRVPVSPGETAIVRVTERPRTGEELLDAKTWWHIRMWGSLAAGLATGGFGTQRMLVARDAAGERDDAQARLALTDNNVDFSTVRQEVVAAEDDRRIAQNVGLSLLAAGTTFVIWSGLEMIFGAPDEGALVAPGLEVYTPGTAPPPVRAPDEPGGPR